MWKSVKKMSKDIGLSEQTIRKRIKSGVITKREREGMPMEIWDDSDGSVPEEIEQTVSTPATAPPVVEKASLSKELQDAYNQRDLAQAEKERLDLEEEAALVKARIHQIKTGMDITPGYITNLAERETAVKDMEETTRELSEELAEESNQLSQQAADLTEKEIQLEERQTAIAEMEKTTNEQLAAATLTATAETELRKNMDFLADLYIYIYGNLKVWMFARTQKQRVECTERMMMLSLRVVEVYDQTYPWEEGKSQDGQTIYTIHRVPEGENDDSILWATGAKQRLIDCLENEQPIEKPPAPVKRHWWNRRPRKGGG